MLLGSLNFEKCKNTSVLCKNFCLSGFEEELVKAVDKVSQQLHTSRSAFTPMAGIAQMAKKGLTDNIVVAIKFFLILEQSGLKGVLRDRIHSSF